MGADILESIFLIALQKAASREAGHRKECVLILLRMRDQEGEQ